MEDLEVQIARLAVEIGRCRSAVLAVGAKESARQLKRAAQLVGRAREALPSEYRSRKRTEPRKEASAAAERPGPALPYKARRAARRRRGKGNGPQR